MKKVLLSVFGASLLTLPIMASNCTPTGGNDCTSEADCTIDEHCHPTLNVCVNNCLKVEGTCDTEIGTTCSEEDIITPINAMSFNGVCVCDPANDTCADGEKCNPHDLTCDVPCTEDADCIDYPSTQTRTCQEGFCMLPVDDCRNDASVCTETQVCNSEDGACIDKCTATSCDTGKVCNESTFLCVDACTAGECAAGEYCDDSRFADTGLCKAQPTTCDQDTCLTSSELCDPDSANESFNQCIDPDDATNTCGAPGSRAASGPIMYVDDPSVDIEVDTDNLGACQASNKQSMAVTFIVDGTISGTGYSSTFWYSDTHPWAANTAFTATATESDLTTLTVYMCLTKGESHTLAFHYNESNRVCVSYDVPN